ncbi:hypothetical protein GEMRC1_010807 [Eukaryota sp. GEM-RC1]
MPGSADSEGRIRVCIRPRPPTYEETKLGACISINNNSITVQKDQSQSSSAKVFHFDAVFPLSSSQQDIYDTIGRPVVADILEGFNGSILAYGQTGTGKTYSMMNTASQCSSSRTSVVSSFTDPSPIGLIPRTVGDIFSLSNLNSYKATTALSAVPWSKSIRKKCTISLLATFLPLNIFLFVKIDHVEPLFKD